MSFLAEDWCDSEPALTSLNTTPDLLPAIPDDSPKVIAIIFIFKQFSLIKIKLNVLGVCVGFERPWTTWRDSRLKSKSSHFANCF